MKPRNKTSLYVLLAFCAVLLGSPVARAEDAKYLDHGVFRYGDMNSGGGAVLARLRPPPSRFRMDARTAGEFTGRRGTRLQIPPDAFVTASGRPVRGKVDVELTEVIDAFDFATAGVDLDYRAPDGKQYYLQSAGMFHLAARKNGAELKLARGKGIRVDFPGLQPGGDFKLYHRKKGAGWRERGNAPKISYRPRDRSPLIPGFGHAPPDLLRMVSAERWPFAGRLLAQARPNPGQRPFAPTPGELISEEVDLSKMTDEEKRIYDRSRVGQADAVQNPGNPTGDCEFAECGYMRVGTRSIIIDGLNWWNFDSPYPHVACVKGRVNDPDGIFTAPAQILAIGIDYKGQFARTLNAKKFKINVHKDRRAKILIIDAKGNIGVSGVIRTPNKNGFDKNPEGPDNFMKDVGTITMRKLGQDIMKDPVAFQNALGLPREHYQVKYPPPGRRKPGGRFPDGRVQP